MTRRRRYIRRRAETSTWPAGLRSVHRLPQLDPVALGVAQLGEEAVRIALGVDLYGLPRLAKPVDHRAEVVDAEVDHPGVLGWTDHLGVLGEGREYGLPRLLAPRPV